MDVSRANRTVGEVNLLVEEVNARAEELEKVRAVFFLKLSEMSERLALARSQELLNREKYRRKCVAISDKAASQLLKAIPNSEMSNNVKLMDKVNKLGEVCQRVFTPTTASEPTLSFPSLAAQAEFFEDLIGNIDEDIKAFGILVRHFELAERELQEEAIASEAQLAKEIRKVERVHTKIMLIKAATTVSYSLDVFFGVSAAIDCVSFMPNRFQEKFFQITPKNLYFFSKRAVFPFVAGILEVLLWKNPNVQKIKAVTTVSYFLRVFFGVSTAIDCVSFMLTHFQKKAFLQERFLQIIPKNLYFSSKRVVIPVVAGTLGFMLWKNPNVQKTIANCENLLRRTLMGSSLKGRHATKERDELGRGFGDVSLINCQKKPNSEGCTTALDIPVERPLLGKVLHWGSALFHLYNNKSHSSLRAEG